MTLACCFGSIQSPPTQSRDSQSPHTHKISFTSGRPSHVQATRFVIDVIMNQPSQPEEDEKIYKLIFRVSRKTPKLFSSRPQIFKISSRDPHQRVTLTGLNEDVCNISLLLCREYNDFCSERCQSPVDLFNRVVASQHAISGYAKIMISQERITLEERYSEV